MKLCIGAASRRVVEVAASLDVPQIVASRRQVDIGGGYTGWDQEGLVDAVRARSTVTQVVRDHGGPHQNGERNDDWVASLDADVDAGFDALHLDVCKLDESQQELELRRLVARYAGGIDLEIGGERDEQGWLSHLLSVALEEVSSPNDILYVVADVGGHIWNDRQIGHVKAPGDVARLRSQYDLRGVKLKAHNMDWFGLRSRYVGAIDAVNIAPEFGNVEIDAWLRRMSSEDVDAILDLGLESNAWTRWFADGEGTEFERARAGLRYLMDTDEVRAILERYDHEEDNVRKDISDAIIHALD